MSETRPVLLFPAALLVGLLGGALSRSLPLRPQELQVKSLVLVDTDGNARAELAMVDARPVLTVRDPKGQDRLRVGLFEADDADYYGFQSIDASGIARVQGSPLPPMPGSASRTLH